jgi:hypothetical protein
MKLAERTIKVIEMTKAEESWLYANWEDAPRDPSRMIEGKRILQWDADDGRNDILLEGENFFRPIYIVNPKEH